MVIPLVISEAGIDGIIGNRPGPDGLGWADFQDYWVQQGWGPDGTQSFINQLAWYDVGTRQDGYVIGFTIFTAGGLATGRITISTPSCHSSQTMWPGSDELDQWRRQPVQPKAALLRIRR